MSTATPLDDDGELRAAELAFGLIDGAERREAETRAQSDPSFAEALLRWQTYAAAMVSGPGEPPRPSIWTAIAARLPANDVAPATPPASSVRWWQAGTGIATAAAAVLAIIAVNRARPPLPAPAPAPAPTVAPAPSAPLVAVLTAAKGKSVMTVSYDRQTGRITSASTGLDIGHHSAELWVIPTGGKPESLGLVDASQPGWTKAPATSAPAIAPGVTLAVSVEPIGGSPTGQPTGPVILTGPVSGA